MISRRGFFGLSASGLLLPRHLLASETSMVAEKKFLFVFCAGGWDTTYCFTPAFDIAGVDVEDDATTAEENGITFVDHEDRPSVRTFFETYGDRACIVNGIEVRSITHERCQLMMMTGGSSNAADDWPSTLAGVSSNNLVFPHLVVYGRAYTSQYTSQVVRVGSNGQLPDLLTGDALTNSDIDFESYISSGGDYAAEAYFENRLAEAASEAARGRPTRFTNSYIEAMDTVNQTYDLADQVTLDPDSRNGCMRDLTMDAATVLDCMEMGLTRTGMCQFDGWCDAKWDTHANNEKQSTHLELLFGYLNEVMEDLDGRSSPTGGALADETVIVVLSEMGRTPTLNAGNGKDHWTFTSAMFIGAGIKGGQVIGGLEDTFFGSPIDLETGEVTDDGLVIQTGNLGATFYALADLDPGDFLSRGEQPISAVLDS